MQVGHVYLVRLQLDNEGRMVGTSRIERFLTRPAATSRLVTK